MYMYCIIFCNVQKIDVREYSSYSKCVKCTLDEADASRVPDWLRVMHTTSC